MWHRPRPDHRARPGRLLLSGLLCLAFAACSTSSNALAPDDDEPQDDVRPPPRIVEVAPAALSGFDREIYKATCQSASGLCPVVRWDGVDYVALSYRDNRLSFAIHAFDESGTLRGVREETGARYLAAVSVDADARTVTFIGQADRWVLLGWDTLQQIR